MKIKLHYALMNLALIFLGGCDDDPVPDSPAKGYERTVLVYWVGDNGSSDLSTFAISDFNEIVEGVESVDVTKNNVVVYSETQNDVPHLIHVSKVNGKVVADTIYTYREQNPLEKSVMSEVISTVMAEFPAKSYGLVFASHADGWLEASKSATRHFGDYRGSNMNITDMRDVLEGFQQRFNFILFDACYMQTIEVAYELKNCADYIIASPTEIPGPGAPYQVIVPYMFSALDAGVHIARGYYEYYGNADGSIKKDASYILGRQTMTWEYGVSISVLKTSELDELAAATEQILATYAGNKTLVPTSGLFNYGYGSGKGGRTDYYDMEKIIAQVTDKNNGYGAWRVAFDNAQPYFQTTDTNYAGRMPYPHVFSMKGAEGVSMYVPKNTPSTTHRFYQTLKWYSEGRVWKSSGW
jgi:hypothetical protein